MTVLLKGVWTVKKGEGRAFRLTAERVRRPPTQFALLLPKTPVFCNFLRTKAPNGEPPNGFGEGGPSSPFWPRNSLKGHFFLKFPWLS